MKTPVPANIDAYITGYPLTVAAALQLIRETVKKAAPDAEETIKYGMPTFTFNGNLVHFAAFKNHIGFYPAPMGVEGFEDDLSRYKTGKGSVQFPLNKPMPLDFIARIVAYRIIKLQDNV